MDITRRLICSEWLPDRVMVMGMVRYVTSARKLPFKALAVTGVDQGSSCKPCCSARSLSIKLSSAVESTHA